jgi:hypothetical protein
VQAADPRLEAAEAGAGDVEGRELGDVDDLLREIVEAGAGDEGRELARDAYGSSSSP